MKRFGATTYLFVAGAFHDVMNPIMNMARTCLKTVEGSAVNPKYKMADKGMADPALIGDKTVLPALGKCTGRTYLFFLRIDLQVN